MTWKDKNAPIRSQRALDFAFVMFARASGSIASPVSLGDLHLLIYNEDIAEGALLVENNVVPASFPNFGKHCFPLPVIL